MLRRTSQLLLPGLLLCLLGAYQFAYPPMEGADCRLDDLPLVLAGLSGEDLPLEQAVLDDLDPDGLLIRRYRRPDGLPIWVVMIYFVNTRLGGHNPELCYLSQGYRTQERSQVELESSLGRFNAESFLAERPGRRERVATFWYTAGGRALGDVRRYRKQLFIQGLRENRSYGIFIRVSTVESSTKGEAEDWIRRFAAEVADHLPQLLREEG